MRLAAYLLILFGAPLPVRAQEAVESYRHALSGGPSLGSVIGGEGPRSSSVGLDYLYRLGPKWEVGVQLDLNYGPGFDGYESIAAVPIVAYAVAARLPVFVGAGFEGRDGSGENHFLARLGFEYVIPLDDAGHWSLLPGGFIDFVNGETILSGVLAIGYSL